MKSLAGVLVICSGCASEPRAPTVVCSTEEIQAALAGASSGDVVEVCPGTFDGTFEVPAGVTLRGAGTGTFGADGPPWADPGDPAELTVLRGPDPSDTVVLRPGSDRAAALEDLVVDSTGVGVRAEGAGTIEISNVGVSVSADAATAVGLDGVTSAVVRDLSIEGRLRSGLEELENPARGLVAFGTTGTFERVAVRGVAESGVALVDSTVSWTEGWARSVLGNGVNVSGGDVTLYDVDIGEPLHGFSLIPSYGLVVHGGANLQTARLRIAGDGETPSIGLLQSGATGQHQNLVVSGHGAEGVVVQRVEGTVERPAFSLTGPDSEISDNRGFGLLVVQSSGVVIDGALVARTRLAPRIVGDLAGVEVGDGVLVVRCGCPSDCKLPLEDIRLANVRMEANARIGLLLDAQDASAAAVEIEAISVTGEGSQLGAHLQGATEPPPGWDTGIERDATVLANDEALAGDLDHGATCAPEPEDEG